LDRFIDPKGRYQDVDDGDKEDLDGDEVIECASKLYPSTFKRFPEEE
jgi:hypothetical protein